MILERKRYTIPILGVVVLAMLAAVVWWSIRPQSDASAALLAQVGESSVDLDSFQYTLTGTRTSVSGEVEAGGTQIGQMELPNKTYGQSFDADGNLLSETKVIDGVLYSRKGGEGLWRKSSGDSSLVKEPGESKVNSLIESAVMFLDNVTLVSEKEVDGATVAHWRGTTNMTRKADTVYWPDWDGLAEDKKARLSDARQQFLTTTETVDVYVDQDTNLLIRTVTTSSLPSVGREDGYTSTNTMEFSRYNETFNITAPAESEIATREP